MVTKTKAPSTEAVIPKAAVKAILAGGGVPALLLQIALINGTIKHSVAVPTDRAGALLPNSTGLADDVRGLRLLMQILGIRSAELDALLKLADLAAGKIATLDTVGGRVDVPTVVLKTGGRSYNISAGIRRTA